MYMRLRTYTHMHTQEEEEKEKEKKRKRKLETTQVPIHRRMNELYYIRIIYYYPGEKINELQLHGSNTYKSHKHSVEGERCKEYIHTQ